MKNMRKLFLICLTALALVVLTQLFSSAAADSPKDGGARWCSVKFNWPVLGILSKGFGKHGFYSGPLSFHSGIDIQAPKGRAVKAAAPGDVLFEGWLRGYGKVVIIDHGRNCSTVYARLSSTHVREGTAVRSGEVIGAVGNTGTAAEYHLHFEVREGGTAKNPMDYLK